MRVMLLLIVIKLSRLEILSMLLRNVRLVLHFSVFIQHVRHDLVKKQ